MKFLNSILVLALFMASCGQKSPDALQAVNPLIGDESFVQAFGRAPDASTDENLRVSTHLAYAEQLLRDKDVSGLSDVRKARRQHLLNLLHDYRVAGVFPRNYDHPESRKPCFIDRDGRICAVGYLVEQTAGREAAERINEKYKYDELLAMNDGNLDEWITANGLTKEEAATIQPGYGSIGGNTNYIKPEYGISSAVLSGVNLSMSAINGMSMQNGSGRITMPIIGLATGAGQIFLGALHLPKEEEVMSWGGTTKTTNESQKVVSLVNIGIGTTTMILSAWSFFSNRSPKESRTSWNIYSFPTTGINSGMALSMTRRF